MVLENFLELNPIDLLDPNVSFSNTIVQAGSNIVRFLPYYFTAAGGGLMGSMALYNMYRRFDRYDNDSAAIEAVKEAKRQRDKGKC